MRWTVTAEDRDSDGRIWITPPARTLADLLPAKPEGEENTPRQPWRPSRLELAGITAGLVLAVALIALIQSFSPRPTPRSAPTAAPQPTQAPTVTIAPTIVLQDAYDAPGGALLGTIPQTATLAYQHSAWPGWAGVAHDGAIVWVETSAAIGGLVDLAPPPTPRPAPRVTAPVVAPAAVPAPPACDVFTNPRYVVEIDLSPIGKVRGVSCNSQEEAEANAAMLAADMRATAEGR